MKPKFCLRSFLLSSGCSILLTYSHAATLYWDGTDSNGNANGGAGTWNTSTNNWDTLSFGGANDTWDSSVPDNAVFGGTAGTVTIGTGGITTAGLLFHTTGYTIAAGSNGLTFDSGTNNIRFSTVSNNPIATITGTVGGTDADLNIVTNPGATSTVLTFSGANTTGWTGTTTIGSGITVNVEGSTGNRALGFTSAITLNGGAIATGSGVTSANNTVNFFNDDADITVNGGGSFTYRPINAGPTFTETIGDVTIHSGEMRFATGSISSGTATLIIPTLTRATTTTSNVVFSLGNNNPLVDGNSNKIQISGSGTTTGWVSGATSNPIIGAWATTGTTGAVDYAVYSGNMVVSALTAASAETNWTNSALAYTLNNSPKFATTLTDTRNVTALKNASTAAALNAVDTGTETITVTGHSFTNGDAVSFGGTPPGGLATGTVYYVIGATADTFQVAATSGGSAINLTGAGSGPNVTGGLKLSSGNNLGTTGILNSSAASFAIGSDGVGAVTLPSTTSANLFANAAVAGITINAPIKNNGAGVLTLVKSGSGTLFLSGANTYTGGTVINAGGITFQSSGAWVSDQNLTFGGTGSFAASIGAITGGTLNVNLGATGSITGTSNLTFTTTTGGGQLIYGGGGSAILNLGDASGFTGNLILSHGIGGTNPRPTVRFSDIGDAVGSMIGWGAAGQGDSNQRAQLELTGDAGPLTFDNRQLVNLPRTAGSSNAKSLILGNNNATAANKWVINTDFLNQGDRAGQGLIFEGSNAGDNQFEGDIGNSTFSGNAMNVYKTGTGKWILSGDNTFTGRLIAGQGTLSVDTLNESNVAGPLGMNNNIQLGGDERGGVGGTATELRLGGGNSGTLQYTGAAVTSSRSFFIGDTHTASGNSGGGTIANNGTGAITFSAATFNPTQTGVTATRTLTLGGTYAVTTNAIQGTIQDNVLNTGKVNLIKANDASSWTLSGTNTYTGTTAVQAGTLIAGTDSLASTNGAFGNSATEITLGVAGGNNNASILIGGAYTVGRDIRLLTNNGTDAGSRVLTLGGNTAANSEFSGNIFLGTNSQAGRGVTLTAATDGQVTFSGVIQNPTSMDTTSYTVTKSGAGTVVFTNTNLYTGATAVSQGSLVISSTGSTHANSAVSVTGTASLVVNGTVNGTVSTAAGTTLSGIGTIVGSTTVQGIHNPGNSPGIQTFGDDLTYSGGSSIVNWELVGNTTTNAANPNAIFDQMLVAGDLNFAATTTVNLVFNGATSNVDWSDDLWNDSQSWLVYDVTGNIIGFDDNLDLNVINWLDGDDNPFLAERAGSTFSFSQAAEGIYLNYTVVPETSTSLLGALGALALLRRRRK